VAHNLSGFIIENLEPILTEWDNHAKLLMGANASKTVARDHAKGMLQDIVADMQERQSPEEQADKSKGLAPLEQASDQAELHGALRFKTGFSIPEMASEFRALRATILRLWNESSATAMQSDVNGIIRFNEGVDKMLAESVERFSADKENDLREATKLADTIIDSAPDDFFMIDTEFRLVRWNRSFREKVGLPDEVLKGKSILNFFLEVDRPLASAKFQTAFAMGTVTMEARWPTIHGMRLKLRTMNRVEIRGAPFLATFCMDVTERRHAEESLADEKEFFNAMLESTPGALYVIDAQGNYCRWNKQLNLMTGLSNSELQCRPWLMSIMEEDRGRAAAILKDAAANGYAQSELRIVSEDGSTRYCLFSIRRFGVKNAVFIVGTGADTTDLRDRMNVLEHEAQTDPLTKVANRSRFIEIANQELARCRRYGHPFSLGMLDIDHFKRVNDTFGHHAGDVALQSVTATSQQALRDLDILGRMGGEEFAVLLPEANAVQSLEVAERLRTAVSATEIPLEDGKVVRLTVSAGIATAKDSDITVDALLERADKALYEAKRTGRDKVCEAVV
jgi:diguanylate cyclase (GGDEF)-like protein/PAS domain S-box-containing protein